MDIERINALAREYAVRLGVREPVVRDGRVPSWMPGGVRTRVRRGRPALDVDPRFGRLGPAEREAVLAEAVACVAVLPGHRRWTWLTAAVFLVAGWATTAGLAGRAGDLPVVLLFVAFISVWVLGVRRFRFAVDRAVAEAFGRAVVDAAIDVDRRNPPREFNAIRMATPSAARRAARLDRLGTSDIP